MRQILLILFIFFLHTARAQVGDKFQIRQYSTENGLPSNGIKGLQWDEKNGFLWIGTEAGVTRFNGIDFKVFSKERVSGSTIDRVSSLINDNNGQIYAFDQVKNIYKVSGNHLVAYAAGGNDVQYLKAQLALINIPAELIDTILELKKISRVFPLLKVIRLDNSSGCLILDHSKKLHYYTLINHVISNVRLSVDSCRDLFRAGDQIFLTDINNNIKMFSKGSFSGNNIPVKDEAGNSILLNQTSLLSWENGMTDPVLFSGENAWLLEYDHNIMRAENICSKMPNNSFIRFAQYYKKGGILFVGTDSKGIIMISKNKVSPVKNPESGINERNAYYSQVKINDSSILTNDGKIVGLPGNTASPPVKGAFSFRTYMNGDTSLWYAQYDIKLRREVLCNYSFTTHGVTSYSKIRFNGAISVAIMNDRTYIVSVDGVGLLDKDSLRYLYKYPVRSTSANEPFDLVQSDAHSLMFATCDCLLKFDVTANKLDTVFTIKGYCIRTLKKYGDYLFLGTYGDGFYIYKNGITRAVIPDKNKFLLYTHCFVFDNNGFCWISTNRGLFKVKSSDLVAAFENNGTQIYYHYLGKNDGMDITEMNGGCSPCAVQLNNSTISFPTMDGLLWVNTKDSLTLLPDGDVFIDDFIVDKKQYAADSAELYLPADSKEIEINFTYKAWCNKENIYIDYRLNDKDKWQAFDDKNESMIRLNNLDQGNYTLQIRKLNGFGENNYTYKAIRFTIATPWYRRWWSYVLLGVFFSGLAVLFYRVRTKQLINKQLKLEKQVAEKTIALQQNNEVLEKNNLINTRLISIISHDIITPLKFLNYAGKNLMEKKDLMPEELKDETIKEITSTSNELQQLSTNILNWIKYQNENRRLAKDEFYIHDMVNQIFGVLNSMTKQKKLELINNVDPEIKLLQYFEPLKIIVYNLVTNAIHFTDKGAICIDARISNENITIRVKDQGVGMTKEQIKNILADQFIISSANVDNKKGNGLGYLIIKDLLKMTGATLRIESEKGKGTCVSVELSKQEKAAE